MRKTLIAASVVALMLGSAIAQTQTQQPHNGQATMPTQTQPGGQTMTNGTGSMQAQQPGQHPGEKETQPKAPSQQKQ